MALPVGHQGMNRPTMELTIELSRKYGFVENEVDLDELIWTPEED